MNCTQSKSDNKDQSLQMKTNSCLQNQDTLGNNMDGKMEADLISVRKFRSYPQAWISLFLLVLLRTIVSVFQNTFSVVPGPTGRYFDISLSAVNWFANVQCIVYFFLSFFTGWIFETLGVKRSIVLSGFLCTLGCAIRCVAVSISTPSYALTMVGQIVGGLAAPLALNITTMFSITWFTEKLRATAGAFVVSNYGAILVMFVIPAITLNETYIPTILNMVAGLSLIVFLPLLFMPKKPPTPPSDIVNSEPLPFIEGFKMLCKNLDFWILFFIHSFNVGLSIAFCALCTQILSPYGYSDKEAGTLNALAYIAGSIGCFIAGPILDKTKKFKLFLRLISPLVFASHLSLYFLIRGDSYNMILFAMALNQLFISFFVPVVMELCTEVTLPVSSAITGSLLWQGAQAFGFIFVIIMDAARDSEGVPMNNMVTSLMFESFVAGIIMVLSFLFGGKETLLKSLEYGKDSIQGIEQYQEGAPFAVSVVTTSNGLLLNLSKEDKNSKQLLEPRENRDISGKELGL